VVYVFQTYPALYSNLYLTLVSLFSFKMNSFYPPHLHELVEFGALAPQHHHDVFQGKYFSLGVTDWLAHLWTCHGIVPLL